MLLIHCPYCEEARPELEFRHAGEAHVPRPAGDAGLSDAETAQRLYYRSNERGLVFERWRHFSGCGKFFNAVRHSVTDKFVMTYKAGEPRPEITEDMARRAGFDANVAPRVMGDAAHTPVARTEAQQ
ncbi:sarcosine oxidase subunit delta [Aureimonas endophytica]|uniref:Sarcosine oxidase subunit delta n=1 Tax=Aureimonas endophytica TaxID=2027858 RepID=A0A917A472_9HYPH|nr:sarcosine oxidase subunit delta [Aureimonas endophytica]GGE24198.1 sarcosine oxidase subunit delta [Aureimonas endophytica]